MVRRIGFGNKDRVWPEGPERLKEPAEDWPLEGKVRPSLAMRLVQVSFLTLWLIGWTAAIVFVVITLISQKDMSSSAFLFFWLIGALIGWFFAARTWIRILRGRQV